LIELHSVAFPARLGWQDIELPAVSQEIMEWFAIPFTAGDLRAHGYTRGIAGDCGDSAFNSKRLEEANWISALSP
jgi:hypothetical protein